MANFIQFRRNRRSSTSSVYMQLLSSLANDLDHMLSELCTTPPPPYDRLSDNELHNRQTSVDINKSGPGTRVTLGHKGTLFENDNHRLDGSAFASRQFKPSGPLTTGGQLDYSHLPSGSGLSVGASNTRGFGTDVSAQGRYNIYNDKRNTLSATGEYSRHFGGPYGTGRPNYGVGLQYEHRF